MIPARRWLPVALLVVLPAGGALVQLQDRLDRNLHHYRVEEQILYLSSGTWVKRLALGYDGLFACLYWTRAVQHYGRENLGRREYRLLYEFLDITTTLDPELLLAYRFGAIFLSEKPPFGPGRPDLAIRLLQKGIEQHPDYWRFYYDLGFVYYRVLRDYAKAAEAFRKGAENPQAAPWMELMATKIAAEGGDRRTARFLWSELYRSTDDPMIRRTALNHLYGLQVDEEIELLEALLVRYRQQAGEPAGSFADLVNAGLLPHLPGDPLGYPYQLQADGTVLLHPESEIFTSSQGRAR